MCCKHAVLSINRLVSCLPFFLLPFFSQFLQQHAFNLLYNLTKHSARYKLQQVRVRKVTVVVRTEKFNQFIHMYSGFHFILFIFCSLLPAAVFRAPSQKTYFLLSSFISEHCPDRALWNLHGVLTHIDICKSCDPLGHRMMLDHSCVSYVQFVVVLLNIRIFILLINMPKTYFLRVIKTFRKLKFVQVF